MNDLEKRVNDLESKFSFQDELVNELNLIVTEQQGKITELTAALKYLKQNSEQGDQNTSLKNERPPHY